MYWPIARLVGFGHCLAQGEITGGQRPRKLWKSGTVGVRRGTAFWGCLYPLPTFGSDVSPWPWPWPRLRRSRPRCCHALHQYTYVLVFVIWNLCPFDTCLKEFWLFLLAQPLVERVYFLTVGWSSAHIACENVRQVARVIVFAKYYIFS